MDLDPESCKDAWFLLAYLNGAASYLHCSDVHKQFEKFILGRKKKL